MRRSILPLLLTVTLFALPAAAQTVVAVQEGAGQAILFSASHPADRHLVKTAEKPHEVELTPDGRTAFISNFGLLEANHKVGVPGTTISVLDVSRYLERTRWSLPTGITGPHGLKLRPPAYRELFTNAEEGRAGMVVLSAISGEVLRTFPLPTHVHNFVFNADGSSLYVFTMDGEVCRLNPENGAVLARVTTGSPRGLAWTADHHGLIASGKGELLLLDPQSLAITRRIAGLNVGQIFYPFATSDGRYLLAPAVLDGVVLVIDAKTGAVVHRVVTGSPLLAVADTEPTRVWISNVKVPANFIPGAKAQPGGVTLLDLNTLALTPVAGLEDTNGVAVSESR